MAVITHNVTCCSSSSLVRVVENVDLLTLILVRSEAKPLMRFKSVSKQWLSLISSPAFCLLHTIQNPNPKPTSLFFQPKLPNHETAYEFVPIHGNQSSPPRTPPFRSLHFSPDPSIEVLSSCNGLLLCSPRDDRKDKPVYVFNPTTERFSVVAPPSHGSSMSAKNTTYSLAFDPSRSPQYKVILVQATPGSNERFEIHIYSSETRLWKKHEHDVDWPLFCMYDQGIYLNGAIHWASKKAGTMCFDLDRECIRAMPELPGNWRWEESVVRYFGESGGDLHLVDIQGYKIMVIDVYVLDRDCTKWTRKYQVDMNLLLDSYPKMISSVHNPLHMDYYNFSVLGLSQVGKDDDELVLRVKGEVISYNCKSNRISELCRWLLLPEKVDHKPLYRLRSFDGHLYSETLACV